MKKETDLVSFFFDIVFESAVGSGHVCGCDY